MGRRAETLLASEGAVRRYIVIVAGVLPGIVIVAVLAFIVSGMIRLTSSVGDGRGRLVRARPQGRVARRHLNRKLWAMPSEMGDAIR